MKRLIFGILPLLAALMCTGAEIPLSPLLPATDAMWAQTRTGRQPPSFYLFSGATANHPAQYEVRGNPPFNLIYNVMNTADEFSACVSLAHEPSPDRDTVNFPVMVEICVDRQIVVKQEIVAGNPPVPVKVDLRGKTQLELRVGNTQGDGQPHQIIWHDPIFVSNDPEQLRITLEKAANDRDAIFTNQRFYPDAPVWRDIAIKKIAWQDYPDAYQIDNGVLQAVFVPAMGGRIVRLNTDDGKNILCDRRPEDRETIPRRGRTEDMTGGHFMRPLPPDYFIPTDPVLEQGPYSVAFPTDGVIVMRSPPSPIFWIQYEYRFEFKMHSCEIRVSNRLINIAPFSRPAGIWSLTRLSSDETWQVSVPHIYTSPDHPLTTENKNGAVNVVRQDNAIIVKKTEKINLKNAYLKLSCASLPMKLQALFKSDRGFLIIYQPEQTQPGILQIFADRFFTELENYGIEQQLEPGGSCSLDEIWLFESPGNAAENKQKK